MIWIRLGSAALFLAVLFGAFGAHALKPRVSDYALRIFETGVQYQVYHGLALLFLGWFSHQFSHTLILLAGWCFVIGIILFSGSLYIMCLSGVKMWGAVTPVGGMAFLLGWGSLFIWSVNN